VTIPAADPSARRVVPTHPVAQLRCGPVRTLVYVDSVYRQIDGAIYGEISFTSFLASLSSEMQVTIIGRLDPGDGPAPYRIPDEIGFVALPHYESLSNARAALSPLVSSLRCFWRTLDDADSVWLFGPYLLSQLFAILALIRRRRVVLGVRQDFPVYVRRRRPTLRWMHFCADILELGWRMWARWLPTVVVGPALADNYRGARRLLSITVSLVRDQDIVDDGRYPPRSYDGDLQVLSVGRLDEEKNPLLLADVLSLLGAGEPRWRMVICGDGALRQSLNNRLAALGLIDLVEFTGHLPLHGGLLDLYRSSHAFLHVSRTEGFPQVLIEAFASGVPVVATAVGGVAAGAGDAAILVAPDDAEAAADAVTRVTTDPALRDRLIAAGFRNAREHTLESEIRRVAEFIAR
jgi:glycosyltransferase involved in cell wall biosynthesis